MKKYLILLLIFGISGVLHSEDAVISIPSDIDTIEEFLRNLSTIDQESFLVKTRKVMETVVNEQLEALSDTVHLPSLFEKLKYLEEKKTIPKTTATLFHTIRKLGNLGAHKSIAINLSDSKIDTILSMLYNILYWHKN